MTEGDYNRGTTSCSPSPRGLRPRRVLAYPVAVTGEPDTSLPAHKRVQAASSGMYSRAVPSAPSTNRSFSLQVFSALLLPFFAVSYIQFLTASIISAIPPFVNRHRLLLNASAPDSSSSAPESITSDTIAPPVRRANSARRCSLFSC